MAKVSHFQRLARCETFCPKSRETFARLQDQFLLCQAQKLNVGQKVSSLLEIDKDLKLTLILGISIRINQLHLNDHFWNFSNQKCLILVIFGQIFTYFSACKTLVSSLARPVSSRKSESRLARDSARLCHTNSNLVLSTYLFTLQGFRQSVSKYFVNAFGLKMTSINQSCMNHSQLSFYVRHQFFEMGTFEIFE